MEGAAHDASILPPSLTRPRLHRVLEFADRGRGERTAAWSRVNVPL